MRAPIDNTLASLCGARHARRIEVVAQCGPRAVHLVRGDLLALATSAEHDAPVGPSADNRTRHGRAERRIVDRILGVRAQVVDLVAPFLQLVRQMLLERIARVVTPDRNAHGGHGTEPPPNAPRIP